MSARQLIVVDTETTGLHADAAILEIAAVNVTTGEELYFVPHVNSEQLGEASPDAMRINRYYERSVYEHRLDITKTSIKYGHLRNMLRGNTFAGCNPAFDARLVEREYVGRDNSYNYTGDPMGQVWHHRLADLSAYAGPALLLAPNELVGLAQVCERLGVTNDGEHTALGDARATAECFRRLTQHYAIGWSR